MQKNKKMLTGKVVSDAMSKSRVVLVSRRVQHPLYGKVMTRSTKFMMHDEQNASKIGDIVRMVYVRPLSSRKCWNLVNIIERT